MIGFFADLGDNPFLASGLVASLLASIGCGVVGPYVVARRVVFLAGAIAHVAVGGIGAAIFLRHRLPVSLSWVEPVHGGMVAALASAVLLAWAHERARDRLDTLIGALWATGMAVGILLVKLTPGYHTELMSYLFGNLTFVSWDQVKLLVALDVVIVATTLLLHKRFLAICLDSEQAALQGVSLVAVNAVLLALVALTVMTLTQVVGLILVLALVGLPATIAAHGATRWPAVVALTMALCAALVTLPRIAVYGTALSPEPVIVLAATACYLASAIWRRWRQRGRWKLGQGLGGADR
jgi:zinc transport system permease protein